MPLIGFLKQSTAVTVMVGPFVDQGDGVTPETGLTLDTSFVKVSKNGAVFAGKSDTTAGTHAEDGYYRVELDTTDVNTVGILTLKVTDSDALPVRQDFQVLEEVVYDDLIGSAAPGYPASSDVWGFGTRTLTAGTNLSAAASDVWAFATRVLTANTNFNDPTAAAIADAVWDEKSTDHVTAGTFGPRQDKSSDVWSFATRILTANTNFNDPTAASIADAVWNEASTDHTAAGSFGLNLDAQVSTVGGGSLTTTDIADKVWNSTTTDHFTAGTFGRNLDAQVSTIGGGSLTTTDIAQKVWNTKSSDHVAAATFGNEVQAHALSSEISALNDIASSDVWAFATRVLTANTNLNDPTAVAIADQVWDEATSGHNTGGTYGKLLRELQSVIAAADGTAQAGTASSITLAAGESAVTDFYKGQVVVIIAQTGSGQARAITAYNGTSKAASISPDWATTPDSTSEYVILSEGSAVVASVDSDARAAVATEVWNAATRVLTANTNLNDPTAATVADAIWDEKSSDHVAAGSLGSEVQSHALSSEITALNDPASSDIWGFASRTLTAGTNLNDVATSDIVDFRLTDSVSSDGQLPTVGQALYEIIQFLQEKSISGTTLTVKKQDGSTALMTFTLDSATAPTSITRAT